MKSYLLCLAIMAFSATLSGQTHSEWLLINKGLSRDTLYTGDTNTILCIVSDDIELPAAFLHLEVINEDRCTDVGEVTIYSFPPERYDDTTIAVEFYLPEWTCQGIYSFSVIDSLSQDLYFYYDEIWVVTRASVVQSPDDQQACLGDTVTFSATIDHCENCFFNWYKDGVFIEDTPWPSLIITNVSSSDTGFYYCMAGNQWGTVTTEPARLEILETPDKPHDPIGVTSLCRGTESTGYHIPSVPGATSYSWSLIPPGAGLLDYADTSATIHWDMEYAGEANLLVKVKTGECRGPDSDTLIISVLGEQPGPEICIVGGDPVTGKNMIVWERQPEQPDLTYIIYRETNQANIYLPLDTIGAEEPSIYIDALSTPELVSQRYKLSLIDTCGFESETSTPHKTIHLTNNIASNGNINLIWDGYEGFAFLSYNLYHGHHADSMEYINTVTSNVFIYSNIVPFPGDNYFQIEAIRPEGCTPSLKSFNYGSSRSNILYVDTETGFGPNSGYQDTVLKIFPSPATGKVTVTLEEYHRPVPAKLLDVSGTLLQEFIMDSQSFELDISCLPDGLYILQLDHPTIPMQAKILKCR